MTASRSALRARGGSRPPSKPEKAPPRPLGAPENFINRQLSWLEFNRRVLAEALERERPLLERLNFLGIVGSNLDEFYMVRVGGLLRLRDRASGRAPGGAGRSARDPAGMGPEEQLRAIAERVHAMVAEQYRCLQTELLPGLARHGVQRVRPETLDRRALALVERWFEDELFPALSPVALEGEESLAQVGGLALHLAVRLRREGSRGRARQARLAFVPLPRRWPRFFQLPASRGHRFVLLEDVVRHFAGRFFLGYEVLEAAVFRLTRNADVPLDDEESEDLLEAMEELLRARQAGEPVRLELEAHASAELVQALASAFRLRSERPLFRLDGPLDLKRFAQLGARIDDPALRFPSYDPQPVPALEGAESLWAAVRAGDQLLHHPYDAFKPVVDLLRSAAADPDVVAIKQTLYRTSEDSPIIDALADAALAGKQVTVLVELKARFDEARNMAWARRLGEAGAQVVYGVSGLKTHAKMLMVVRREADTVRRYVHLSTGNYNDVTTRLYEDVGLITCDPDLGADASNFFNAVTGYSEPRAWRHLAIAPTGLRARLYRLIDREIASSSAQSPGLIRLKMNALDDPALSARLYDASCHGVRIQLCVRGVCCLRPGIPGLSANIEVRSVVGRFLEHSRIYHFHNAGRDEVFLASADFMPRNLDRRLEAMFPVRDEGHRRRLLHVLDVLFEDNRQAWRLRPDGSYERTAAQPSEPVRCAQEIFMEEALARAETARVRRISSFRPLGPGMAPGHAGADRRRP